jgi:hypothetical protein
MYAELLEMQETDLCTGDGDRLSSDLETGWVALVVNRSCRQWMPGNLAPRGAICADALTYLTNGARQ